MGDSTQGSRIRQARVFAKLSGGKLARVIGKEPNTVWRYERNELLPRETVLADIAQACGVNLRWLKEARGPMRARSAA